MRPRDRVVHRAHVTAETAALISLLIALVPGCSSERVTQGPDAASPKPPEPTITSTSPRTGTVGAMVRLRAAGFPQDSTMVIGFGPLESEYEVIGEVPTTTEGSVDTSVAVPHWAEENQRYVFVVAARDARPRAISSPFHVTGDWGAVTVEGEILGGGAECPALRTRDGTIYTLAGRSSADLRPGTRVWVEGTVAEVSICMQGITIQVRDLRRL